MQCSSKLYTLNEEPSAWKIIQTAVKSSWFHVYAIKVILV